jgi:hypothetical protein
MVQDMHSFLSQYSTIVFLAPPRHQVPRGTSRVVPGAHRVVGPGTHRGSGPREVHTTKSDANIVTNFKASGMRSAKKGIAKWVDEKFEPFVCLVLKPSPQKHRLEKK